MSQARKYLWEAAYVVWREAHSVDPGSLVVVGAAREAEATALAKVHGFIAPVLGAAHQAPRNGSAPPSSWSSEPAFGCDDPSSTDFLCHVAYVNVRKQKQG